MKKVKSEAHTILSKTVNIEERAEMFLKSIKKTIKRKTIETLEEQISKLKDTNYSIKDRMTVATDVNKGVKALSMQECTEFFQTLMENEYELELLEEELRAKKRVFKRYFGKIAEETVEDKEV